MKPLLFSVTIDHCEVQTFTCPGKGGQHVNRAKTGVRIIHKPSGATGRATDTRDQHRNKRLAFERMAYTDEYQTWVHLEAARLSGQPTAEAVVEQLMQPSNLKIEVRDDNGQWETEQGN